MKHLIAVLITAGLCSAQVAVSAARVIEAPVIDGVPDEAVWNLSVPVTEDFIQHRPHCGEPMSEETTVMVVYDERNIYFAFTMKDSCPERFVRMVAPRDHDFSSEWVGIWLDTFNDDNNAYFFFVNVDNVQQDGRLCAVSGWDQNWDGVWSSATAVSDPGWTAEFAIPFADLRYSREPEQLWGVNFKRTITRTNESGFLFRMEDSGDIRIEDFGDLCGLSNLPSNRTIELRPYGAGHIRYLPDGDDEWDPWMNAGIDAKVGLSSQLLLDLTVNPDFGQVEADPDQVSLSHWETYLSEKRPFFLEGSDMFSMPFNLFYSRRIGSIAPNGEIIPILGGAKLTGSAGGLRVGFLEACTGKVDEGEATLARTTNYVAGRLIEEFGEGTYIGLCATSTDIPESDGEEYVYGRSGALDGQVTFLDHHTINGAIAGTWNSTDSAWDDNLSYRGWYSFENERLDMSCGVYRSEDNFNANMIGYTSATGQVETWADADLYVPFSSSTVFQHWWGGIVGWYDRVPDGPVTAQGISFNTGTVFRNRCHIAFDMGYDGKRTDRYEGPDGTEYEGGMNYGFSCSSDYRKPLHGDLWAGINNYCEGWNRYAGSWMRYRPLPYFTLEADLDWSTTSDARKFDWESGGWGIRDTDWRSAELSANWMFTNELGLRITSQLSRFQLEWDSGYSGREYYHWLNALLSWQFRPGSMFYFMMGENAEPDEVTGDSGDPEFTVYTKLTWFI
ncbi:MAG: carbohydrate binding family 9 domain-containing protein [Candidatus Fermentibacteraceae bacterium]|nr:carbohydrate binding family 9 domain-containing protein [Candidatus Fermentibacteraceae bacterium]MBN2609468.1 carbohydrate binding family 9 domain-containing protein [Candidatus Fermentibacteraceae bacterium]